MENKFVKMYNEAMKKRISRSKAIRLKCLDCCGFQSNEVKECPSKNCPLWRFRMGYEERDNLYASRKKGIKENEI